MTDVRCTVCVCAGVRGDPHEADGPGPRRQTVASGLQAVGAPEPVTTRGVRHNISVEVGRLLVPDHVHAPRDHHALQVVSQDCPQTRIFQ